MDPSSRAGGLVPSTPPLDSNSTLDNETTTNLLRFIIACIRNCGEVVKMCRVIVGGKEDGGGFLGAVLSRVDHSQPRSFGRGFGRCSRLLPACQDEHGDVGLEPSLWHDRQGDAESTCDEAPRGAADKWR